MEILLLALTLFLQNSGLDAPHTHGAVPNILGTWQGGLLPPGISPFETIKSTTTFAPNGTFTLRVFKPTGTFSGGGTFFLDGDTVTVSIDGAPGAVGHFRAARNGTILTLQPLDPDGSPLMLYALPVNTP